MNIKGNYSFIVKDGDIGSHNVNCGVIYLIVNTTLCDNLNMNAISQGRLPLPLTCDRALFPKH